MKSKAILSKFEHNLKRWTESLDAYSDEDFVKKPSSKEWSMAQVYDHLIKVNDLCITYALRCANKEGESGHLAIGPAIFSLMGSFPPVKIRVKNVPSGMESVYLPKPISKEEAKQGLERSLAIMKDSIAAVESADKTTRVRHWAGGWFNSRQWFQNAEMHLRHHFRQKKRIEKYLKLQKHN